MMRKRVRSARRQLLAAIASLTLAPLAFMGSAVAQTYPDRTINYIVTAGVGGGSDILARTLVRVLEEKKLLPVNVLVENRTGGSGAIGYNYINARKGDPYVLGGVGVSYFTTPLLGRMAFNYKSFTPLAAVARSPYILAVRTSSPIEKLDDLKSATGLRIGTVGAVSDPALLSKMVNQQLGTEIRVVPFDGGGEVLSAVLGGHLDMLFGNPNEILEQVKAGTMRPIAVTSGERMTSLPDVPTFKELGYDIEHTQLRGIIMPGDVDPKVVEYWEDVLKSVAQSPEWKAAYLERFNEIPLFLDSAGFAAEAEQTATRYEAMMRDLNLIQ